MCNNLRLHPSAALTIITTLREPFGAEYVEATPTTVAKSGETWQQQGEEGLPSEPSTTTSITTTAASKYNSKNSKSQVVVLAPPSRAVCREVAEKYLSWEFQDRDFARSNDNRSIGVEEKGGYKGVGVPGGGVKESAGAEDEAIEDLQDTAAVRAALFRREKKLIQAFRGVQTNDEAGATQF